MSKNLLKSYFFARDPGQEACVINTNELVEQKLERIRMVLGTSPDLSGVNVGEGGYEEGIFATSLDALVMDGEASEEGAFEEGTISNIIKANPEPVEPVYTGPSPEELIAQAQEEIEVMKAQARQEIESEKARVFEEAQNAGYAEGVQRAQQENESYRAQMDEERYRMQELYEQKVQDLEPAFVKTLTGIYEKIFEVDLAGHKDIILAMLRNTMKKLEGGKNFLIHISSVDYSYVKEHKDELLSDATQEGTVVDVVEDGTLRENECTIETANGIFDCGLGTQMAELKKRLILLSYEDK